LTLANDYNIILLLDPDLTALPVSGSFPLSSVIDDLAKVNSLLVEKLGPNKFYLSNPKIVTKVYPRALFNPDIEKLFTTRILISGDSLFFRGSPIEIQEFEALIDKLRPPPTLRARLVLVVMDEALIKEFGVKWNNNLSLALSIRPSFDDFLGAFRVSYSSAGSNRIFGSTADLTIDLVSGRVIKFAHVSDSDRSLNTINSGNIDTNFTTGYQTITTGLSIDFSPVSLNDKSWSLAFELNDSQKLNDLQRSRVTLSQSAIFDGSPRMLTSYTRSANEYDKKFLPELGFFSWLPDWLAFRRSVASKVSVAVFLLPVDSAPVAVPVPVVPVLP